MICRTFASLVVVALGCGWAVASDVACTDCHDVGPGTVEHSVHGFLECADCHSGTEQVPHPEGSTEADCSTCHEDVVSELEQSVHGGIGAPVVDSGSECSSCHGPIHTLVPGEEPESPIHPSRLPDTCGSCHADPDVAERYRFHRVRPVEAYRASVHGRAREAGVDAAGCEHCHGSHAILPAADPSSPVNHWKVSETCGQCHGEITRAYRSSIHGQAVADGVREAPVCTDCHGEHRILSPREKGSPVFATNVPKMTCGRCHSDLRLAEKFGIPADAVSAYADSYHGLASRSGATTVAHCGSCHGVHDVLPSSDPASHVHEANLPSTCGRCHPGAGQVFSIGPVHVLPTEPRHTAVYIVRAVYMWLIYVVIGAMVLHNLLDFRRKFRSPPPRTADPAPAEERMMPGFRFAHALLAISFVVLAYTGFALKYPEAWWARPVIRWEGELALRGWLHRAAAIVMMGSLVFHAVHLALSRRARACIAKMRPRMDDARELRERIAYFFGRREAPPFAGSVGYPEKIEYIALMWGLAVMAVTGFVLWFDNLVLRWLPKWVTDVATVIHFYEAVLASLAIVVWHLYFVIFDPVVYPMDTAWLNGRSPEGRILERKPPPRA